MKNSKTKLLKNFLTILLIMVIPTQSLASEGIFFNLSSVKKIASDMDFYKKTKENDIKIIMGLKESNTNYLNLSKEYENKIIGIEKDKEILKTRGDKLEGEYKKTSIELQDCIESKPSRMVWFGTGLVTAILLGSLAAYTLK